MGFVRILHECLQELCYGDNPFHFSSLDLRREFEHFSLCSKTKPKDQIYLSFWNLKRQKKPQAWFSEGLASLWATMTTEWKELKTTQNQTLFALCEGAFWLHKWLCSTLMPTPEEHWSYKHLWAVGAGNWTWDHWKSSQCSYPLCRLFRPHILNKPV